MSTSKPRGPPGPAPTTPLRRISRGSLNALSHSASKQIAAGGTPLSFLQGAMSDLAEELSVLQLNLESVHAAHQDLESFNENFAMYIYGLKMNAYCVEWPEAPQPENFARAEKRLAQQAEQMAAQQQLHGTMGGGQFQYGSMGMGMAAGGYGGADDMSMYNSSTAGGAGAAADQTYVTADDESIYRDPPASHKPLGASSAGNAGTRSSSAAAAGTGSAAPTLKSALKKSSVSGTGTASTSASATKSSAASAPPTAAAARPKVTLAQKKKREAYSDEIIDTLPLEYRGNDPRQTALARHVCMCLIAAGSRGVRIADIVKNPDFSQAKVNKALIALVAAKHVQKTSNNGIVYSLDSGRHPALP
ncbi:hypothetical protein BCV70DRAFT_200686 [Testicularia cyperi]|uniref:DASH complex subunit DAM1 n=1 Tax=Testicularia cyperi TaxID=1882483 RepID=A0A317XN88_9BASI|nr:hypothetical protein BCV70DRAFT_200686 [Testicularia cyperi]